MFLADVAQISSGFLYLEEKKASQEQDTLYFIQPKDIDRGKVKWGQLSPVAATARNKSDILSEGDILLRAKGVPHTAVLLDKPSKDVLAGSQFFVVKPKQDIVTPEYMTWYINQKPTQDYLNQMSQGTNIKQLRKNMISYLPLEIPPIVIQKKVVHLYNLAQQEKGLVTRIQAKREQLLQAQLLRLIRKR